MEVKPEHFVDSLGTVSELVELIEGFRPERIVRLLADKWPLDDLPWEEMLWQKDNRVK